MIVDLSSYQFSSESRLFLDTNIWMSLYAPPSNPVGSWVNEYSRYLKKAKRACADLYIDSTVISEYLNAYVRAEFKALYESSWDGSFKAFRDGNSAAYIPIARKAAKNMKEILSLPNMSAIDCPTSHIDLEALLSDYECGGTDWNDQVISEVCRTNRFDLVTNDRDFRDSDGLSILTVNPRLLGR